MKQDQTINSMMKYRVDCPNCGKMFTRAEIAKNNEAYCPRCGLGLIYSVGNGRVAMEIIKAPDRLVGQTKLSED